MVNFDDANLTKYRAFLVQYAVRLSKVNKMLNFSARRYEGIKSVRNFFIILNSIERSPQSGHELARKFSLYGIRNFNNTLTIIGHLLLS